MRVSRPLLLLGRQACIYQQLCPKTKSRWEAALRLRTEMVYQREIHIQTSGHKEMHNLTDEVARVVNESKVRHGIVHIFNIGSTAAIGTIEFEPGLQEDLPKMLDKLMPPSRDYGHERA